MGFKGASVHMINQSGRISIPSKIRDVLRAEYNDDSLVLVLGRKFLVAYPILEWDKFEANLEANPPQNTEDANTERRLYATLEDVVIDKQGRILISNTLRERVGLTGDCVIVGRNNRIEIWNKAEWDSELNGGDNAEAGAHSGTQFNQLFL